MQQSMRILQMGSFELSEFVQNASLENPLLDFEAPQSAPDTLPIVKVSSSSPEHKSVRKRTSANEKAGLDNLVAVPDWKKSLEGSLCEQLATLDLSPRMECLLRYLIGNLDSNGYLLLEYPEFNKACHATQREWEEAVSILQTLEPVGVGARNLGECLCIQLHQNGETDEMAYRIARDYIEYLGKGQMHKLAGILEIDDARVQNIKEVLSRLNPKPANGYDTANTSSYIVPDIYINREPSGWEIVLNKTCLPKISINDDYQALLQSKKVGKEEAEYMTAKLKQAQWILHSVARREITLRAFAEQLLKTQESFFLYGPKHLKALTMQQMADLIDMHASTVSRTAKDKFLQCQWGVFPLSYFFARSVGDVDETTHQSGHTAKH